MKSQPPGVASGWIGLSSATISLPTSASRLAGDATCEVVTYLDESLAGRK